MKLTGKPKWWMLSPMLFYAFTYKMFIKLLNIPPRYAQHLLKML